MAAVTIASGELVRQPNPDKKGVPRKDNGELTVYLMLRRAGLQPVYEPFIYPLSFNLTGNPTCQFMPDFWVEQTKIRPEFHVEVTTLNRPAAPTQDQVDRLAKKRWKVRRLQELYGIATVLVTAKELRALTLGRVEMTTLIGRVVAL